MAQLPKGALNTSVHQRIDQLVQAQKGSSGQLSRLPLLHQPGSERARGPPGTLLKKLSKHLSPTTTRSIVLMSALHPVRATQASVHWCGIVNPQDKLLPGEEFSDLKMIYQMGLL